MNRNMVDMILYIKKMELKGIDPENIKNNLLMRGYNGHDVKKL